MTIDPVLVAEKALNEPVASSCIDKRIPIEYDPFLAGRLVDRVTGTACLRRGSRRPWSAIIKRTTGPGLRAARREAAAYLDGLTTLAPEALHAPSLLASDIGPDHVELWLEEVTDQYQGNWPVQRFGTAAAHIAQWAAQSSRTDMPPDFDSEDAWAERHGQPHRVEEALTQLQTLRTAAPGLSRLADDFRDPDFRKVEALIASTADRIQRLAGFQRTLMHHDLVRSNLFAIEGFGTAAIDWENVGNGPFGVELAPLVFGSVRRGEASADDLPAIEQLVLSAYTNALHRNGIDKVDDSRTAYRLAVGLRWHVVLGTISAWLDPNASRIRGSRPTEPRAESLRHLTALSRQIIHTDPLIN